VLGPALGLVHLFDQRCDDSVPDGACLRGYSASATASVSVDCERGHSRRPLALGGLAGNGSGCIGATGETTVRTGERGARLHSLGSDMLELEHDRSHQAESRVKSRVQVSMS
jgi:hypothetical protein